MRKVLLQLAFAAACTTAAHANSLLKSPVTGPLGHSLLGDICIAANASDVVLLAADNSAVYAIDIDDNNPADATANTVTTIPSFVTAKLDPVAGTAVTVKDIVVNPISKAVYVLATAGTNSYIFKVKNNGADITLLDLSNISHSTVSWGASLSVNDMAWGNNTLYVTSGSFTLNGSIGWLTAPFEHSTSFTTRATSMFKSNWGGSYFTDAPLETIDYGYVNSEHRLMGVTTCAPGFSLNTTKLTGSGVLEVTEDFNVQYGTSEKVVFQKHDGKNWLFDLHDNNLYRIGEKYLDGSQVTAMKYNNSAEVLRSATGAPATGLTDAEMKKYTGTYKMISFWDDYRLLLLESGTTGALKLFQTAATIPTSIAEPGKTAQLKVFPNPAHNALQFEMPAGSNTASARVYGTDGRLLLTQVVSSGAAAIDISSLSKGNYLLSISANNGTEASSSFVVE